MPLSVISIKSTPKDGKFDLFESLKSDLEINEIKPQTGDVIVISSKYVANSQGRIVEYDKVIPSPEAERVASRFQIKPKIAEVILRESDVIFGGIPGFVITSSDYIMAPNAGIDKSNAKKGSVILYPTDPYVVAEQLRRKFLLTYQIHVGIIIVDSRLMPSRVGTIGVAIACSGIEPLSDLRGQKDLHGNPLKVTLQAVADNLASIANLKMGEGSEAIPAALVRDSGAKLTDRQIRENEMAISYDQCVYVRGLGTRI
ncbi:MAG TPA: coenzyme F420-0:L-glutamate ligase [Candidatus Nitrosotalea sp.]|nr:coenzyme F420-0:L-glutamate ligase [Nitrososphaerota archaeon]HKU33259.1 coenzyme F420-0:L-glutamate ligase [Candidatus Nitrosotalea sp.]